MYYSSNFYVLTNTQKEDDFTNSPSIIKVHACQTSKHILLYSFMDFCKASLCYPAVVASFTRLKYLNNPCERAPKVLEGRTFYNLDPAKVTYFKVRIV